MEYQPNDFVLYLLFSLCGAYLKFRGADEDDRSDAATRLHRLRAFRSRRSQLADVAQPSGGNHDKLIREARSYRKQIQAQQSRTTTFGAGLSTPGNIASTSGQVATTATDLPWNYPELVSTFSSFLQEVALELRGPDKENAAAQEVRGRVIIGIDELDKISDAEQAQRFVNELKVILGVPYCHYLISISDDALAAYEMRGLPVRDAFDSAFDEVIHVRYLNLDGSRELLALRVIGMSDPFISLCHCLSGGLPRDLIRSARHVVITARRLTESGFDRLDAVCQQLVLEELRRKLDASWINRAGGRLGRIDSELLHSIQRLVAYQPDSGESPVDCDLRTGRTLRTELGPIVAGRPLAGPPPAAPPAAGPPAAGPPEPAAVPELACYLHYLLTLLEVFTPALSADGTIVDTRGRPAPDALFNQLCLARQTLGTDPRWSWLTVETFRETWGLEPRYPYPDRS